MMQLQDLDPRVAIINQSQPSFLLSLRILLNTQLQPQAAGT